MINFPRKTHNKCLRVHQTKVTSSKWPRAQSHKASTISTFFVPFSFGNILYGHPNPKIAHKETNTMNINEWHHNTIRESWRLDSHHEWVLNVNKCQQVLSFPGQDGSKEIPETQLRYKSIFDRRWIHLSCTQGNIRWTHHFYSSSFTLDSLPLKSRSFASSQPFFHFLSKCHIKTET